MRSKWLSAVLALVAVLGITTAASAMTRGNPTIQKHDLTYVQGSVVTVQPQGEGTAWAVCPSGDKVVGGGYGWDGVNGAEPVFNWSSPASDLSRWIVSGRNPSSTRASLIYAMAVCAS